MKLLKTLIFLFLFISFFSCKKDPEIKVASVIQSEDNYLPVVPEGWPTPVYKFQDNPVTYDGFTLGRHLFYEPMISEDTTISCGSCHMQTFGFSNGPSHALSHGVHNLLGTRNAPALYNLTWHSLLRWDGGVINLETQPINPIKDPHEMNMDMDSVLRRIGNSAKYKTLFKKAFGDTVVDSQRFLRAFAQFTGLLVSYNSKYDKVKRGEEGFTTSENNGYNVYKSKCASCHTEPLFSDYKFRNKGLPVTVLQDSGRWMLTHASNDLFEFKTPSLRNLGFTAPYMHDGRFNTLDQVITFFTSGVATLPNLDPVMAAPHTITTQEKNDLLSFLATLNDYKFINDPRFSEIQ